MLTVEGPWSPDRRRRLSPKGESEEGGEPLTLDEIAARIEAEISPKAATAEIASPETPGSSEVLETTSPFPATPPGEKREKAMHMQEFVGVRQRTDEGFRRYFVSDFFKLWVWYDFDKTAIQGFQLLWGGDDHESAITWRSDGTFSHREIADEGSAGASKMTQVLEGDAGQIRPSTIHIFRKYAAKIEQSLVGLVVSKIMEKTGITQAMLDDVEKEYRKSKTQRLEFADEGSSPHS